MMIKAVLGFFLLTNSAFAYVPTVESLFRNGENPDVSANGISVTFTLKKNGENDEYYRIFFTKNNSEGLRVAQAKYKDASYSEDSLVHKYYLSSFTPYSIKPLPEQMDRGLFYNSLYSMVFNGGTYLVNYLKSAGAPVKLNSELINRQKVEYLADYKRYLVMIGKDRGAKKSEVNPLKPEDPAARDRVERVMNESMYVDTRQSALARVDGDMVWLVTAGAFEGVVSYKKRNILKLHMKTDKGDVEITAKDYWLANGTHSLPRFMMIKNSSGDVFQLEFKNLKHYLEKEEDLVKRLSRWDQILKGKDHPEVRPTFLF